MAVSIRGDKEHVRILRDGATVGIYEITNVSIREDAQVTDSLYVGAKKNEPDKAQMGWSGSFEMEVKNSEISAWFKPLTRRLGQALRFLLLT